MTNGKSIAAMIMGIVAIIIAWFGWSSILSIILSIIGIVLAVSARKEGGSGVATAGLVLSIIALIISGIGFFACFLCAGAVAAFA